MTQQELEDNYEYKVTKKALLREFPFITKVFIKHPDEVDKYSTMIFFDVEINPYVLAHMFGLTVDKITDKYLRSGQVYWSPYLGSFIKGGQENVSEIMKAIRSLMNGIHNSPAIPKELKLNKTLDIGTYISNPDVVPDSMTNQN